MAHSNIAVYIGLTKLLTQTRLLRFEGSEVDLKDIKNALKVLKDEYEIPDNLYEDFLKNIKLAESDKKIEMSAEALNLTIESSMKSSVSEEMLSILSLIEVWTEGDFPAFELNTKCNYLKNVGNFAELNVDGFIEKVKLFSAMVQSHVCLLRVIEHGDGWEFYVKSFVENDYVKDSDKLSELLELFNGIVDGSEISSKKIHKKIELVLIELDQDLMKKQNELKKMIDLF